MTEERPTLGYGRRYSEEETPGSVNPYESQNIFEESEYVQSARKRRKTFGQMPDMNAIQKREIYKLADTQARAINLPGSPNISDVDPSEIDVFNAPVSEDILRAFQSTILKQNEEEFEAAEAIEQGIENEGWLDWSSRIYSNVLGFSSPLKSLYYDKASELVWGEPDPMEDAQRWRRAREGEAGRKVRVSTPVNLTESVLKLGTGLADWALLGEKAEYEEKEIPYAYVETEEGRERLSIEEKSQRGRATAVVEDAFDGLRSWVGQYEDTLTNITTEDVAPLEGEQMLDTTLAQGLLKEVPEGARSSVEYDLKQGNIHKALQSVDIKTALKLFLKYGQDPDGEETLEEVDAEANEPFLEKTAEQIERDLGNLDINLDARNYDEIFGDAIDEEAIETAEAVGSDDEWRKWRAEKSIEVGIYLASIKAAPKLLSKAAAKGFDKVAKGTTLGKKIADKVGYTESVSQALKSHRPLSATVGDFNYWVGKGVAGLSLGNKIGLGRAMVSLSEEPEDVDGTLAHLADSYIGGFKWGIGLGAVGWGTKATFGYIMDSLKSAGIEDTVIKSIYKTKEDLERAIKGMKKAAQTGEPAKLSKARAYAIQQYKNMEGYFKDIAAAEPDNLSSELGKFKKAFKKGLAELDTKIKGKDKKAEFLVERFIKKKTGMNVEEFKKSADMREAADVSINVKRLTEDKIFRKNFVKKMVKNTELENPAKNPMVDDGQLHLFDSEKPDLPDDIKADIKEKIGVDLWDRGTASVEDLNKFNDYVTNFMQNKIWADYVSGEFGEEGALFNNLINFGKVFGETRSTFKNIEKETGIDLINPYYNLFSAKNKMSEVVQANKERMIEAFKGIKSPEKVTEALIKHQKYIAEGGKPIGTIAKAKDISREAVLQNKYGLKPEEAQTASKMMNFFSEINAHYRHSDKFLHDYVPLLQEKMAGSKTQAEHLQLIDRTGKLAKIEQDIPFEQKRILSMEQMDMDKLVKDPIRLYENYMQSYARRDFVEGPLKVFDEKLDQLSYMMHGVPYKKAVDDVDNINALLKYGASVRQEMAGTPTGMAQLDRWAMRKLGDWMKKFDERTGNAIVRYSDSRGVVDAARNAIMTQFMALRADHAARNMIQPALVSARVGSGNLASNAIPTNVGQYGKVLASGDLNPALDAHMDMGPSGVGLWKTLKGAGHDITKGLKDVDGLFSKLRYGAENVAESAVDGHLKETLFFPLRGSDAINRTVVANVGSNMIEKYGSKLIEKGSKAKLADIKQIPGLDTAMEPTQLATLQAAHTGKVKAFITKDGTRETITKAIEKGHDIAEGKIDWDSVEGILMKDMVLDTQFMYDTSNLGYLFRKKSGPLNKEGWSGIGLAARLFYAQLQSWNVFGFNYLKNIAGTEGAAEKIGDVYMGTKLGTALSNLALEDDTTRWYDPGRIGQGFQDLSPLGDAVWNHGSALAWNLMMESSDQWDEMATTRAKRGLGNLMWGDHTSVGRVSNIAEEMYNVVSDKPRDHSAMVSMLEESLSLEFKEKHKRRFTREISSLLRSTKKMRQRMDEFREDNRNTEGEVEIERIMEQNPNLR